MRVCHQPPTTIIANYLGSQTVVNHFLRISHRLTTGNIVLAIHFRKQLAEGLFRPGWQHCTAWGETASAAWHDRVREETPRGVWGLPEDVTAAALWLASPTASLITGQTIRVNGGAVR